MEEKKRRRKGPKSLWNCDPVLLLILHHFSPPPFSLPHFACFITSYYSSHLIQIIFESECASTIAIAKENITRLANYRCLFFFFCLFLFYLDHFSLLSSFLFSLLFFFISHLLCFYYSIFGKLQDCRILEFPIF